MSTQSVSPLSSAPNCAAAEPIQHSDLSGGVFLDTTAAIVSQQQRQVAEGSERIKIYPASGIISYAQNREDILLWRALHDVENGFYVDVGAQDPSDDSVTRAFYDRGWSGINIEPVTGYFEKLTKERPRDLTLGVALGDRAGWATLYEFSDTGLSTLVHGVAYGHRAKGFCSVDRRVPILTLAKVWDQFVNWEVHFLKIDVEGFERQVLAGAALTRFRPWIILVEATEPLTSEGAWEIWEPILLGARYECVHFDGLNRWYLAQERSHLKLRFEIPPNIFDGFQTAAVVALQQRVATAEREVKSLQHRVAAVECNVKRIKASASWRITEPLRVANDSLRAAVRWVLRVSRAAIGRRS